jgi:cytochrome P450
MCHYPEVQRKVSAEIDEFIERNGRIPHFKEREQLPYCISVMKESMRYKPTTTFGVLHTAHEDCNSFFFYM